MEDFDVIKDYAEAAEGNRDAWNEMMELAGHGLLDAVSYYGIQGKDEFGNDDPSKEAYLNVENLMDYMLLNFYVGNLDWDHHNWVAARNRVDPGMGFQFFPWDSERTFYNVTDNVVEENNENKPSFLFSQLRHNPVFRNQFRERANEILGPGGLLSADSAKALWDKRSKEIEMAVIVESARWGDYRRDVHPYKNDPYELYTKNDYWLKEQEKLTNDYFPVRSQIVLDQLRAIGLAGEIITGTNDQMDLDLESKHKSFPNPFNGKVTIQLKTSNPGYTVIDVYTKEGKVVDHLYKGFYDEKLLEIFWKPKRQTSGLYYYRIETDENIYTGKMVYVR